MVLYYYFEFSFFKRIQHQNFALVFYQSFEIVKHCSRFWIGDGTCKVATDRDWFSFWSKIWAGNAALCALPLDSPVWPELQNQFVCFWREVSRAGGLTEPGRKSVTNNKTGMFLQPLTSEGEEISPIVGPTVCLRVRNIKLKARHYQGWTGFGFL